MANVNLAPGQYTSVIAQLTTPVSISGSGSGTVVSTSSGQAAFIYAIWIANTDAAGGTCVANVYVGGALIASDKLEPKGKRGSMKNMLEGAPLVIPESTTVSCDLDGGGVGAKAFASWVKIT